jgi:hypothetical protein
MSDRQRPMSWYEIRIKGHLDERWSAWFSGLAITHPVEGETLLAGPVRDQAALHGVLAQIRDLGLSLLSINQSEKRQ